MSTIYLFRHGITEGNKRRLYYGSSDIPLIEEGIEAIKTRREAGIYPDLSGFEVITTDLKRTEQTLFEILPKGTNKGILLPHFEKILGVKKENIIAIGDYHNDIGMLRAAGLGVAVANAVPEAKAAADLVTVSNDEHAIAAIVARLDEGLR